MIYLFKGRRQINVVTLIFSLYEYRTILAMQMSCRILPY
jgi:hypothetical protein